MGGGSLQGDSVIEGKAAEVIKRQQSWLVNKGRCYRGRGGVLPNYRKHRRAPLWIKFRSLSAVIIAMHKQHS